MRRSQMCCTNAFIVLFFAVLVFLPTSILTLYLHPRVFFWKHKASQMQGLRPYTESRVVIAGVESIESRAWGGQPSKAESECCSVEGCGDLVCSRAGE